MADHGRQGDHAGIDRWQKALELGRFERSGLERLSRSDYQYESIGLGGATLRVGPHGFTAPGAPRLGTSTTLECRPYFGYQYWWDEDGHRVTPFEVIAGYGDDVDPGEIVSFRHDLDIRCGHMTIDLTLRVGGVLFESRREMFVSPTGIWAIRISDSPAAPSPCKVQVSRREVWPGGFFGIVCPDYKPIIISRPDPAVPGLVALAQRPGACSAALSIVCDEGEADASTGTVHGARQISLFVAAASSYERVDPVECAWAKARDARTRGYDALLCDTETWWNDYYASSRVQVPDETLMRWYARSLYYHGVYFGNTDIPPGCFSTNPAGFLGTVCPEFDLAFSQYALLYSNHLDEARRVCDWLGAILPKSRQNALGITLHKTSIAYNGGAYYGWLVGYDGTIMAPPTEGEGANLFSKFCGSNAAAMALAYADWSGDDAHAELARTILKETTQVIVEDLVWDDAANGYQDRRRPGGLNAAAAQFGLCQALARGVADDTWRDYLDKLALPHATYHGRAVLFPTTPRQNGGDAPILKTLWWYGNHKGTDPVVRATYDIVRHSRTGNYVFNNGWMAVCAAKLGLGDDAHQWLKNMIAPGPGVPQVVFDDTNFGEIVADDEDYRKAPEIGAHGAYICGTLQMLVDPDDSECVTIFPALPSVWNGRAVSFVNVAVTGGLRVSAERSEGWTTLSLRNTTSTAVTRALRVRLGHAAQRTSVLPKGAHVENGDIIVPSLTIEAGAEFTCTLVHPPGNGTAKSK